MKKKTKTKTKKEFQHKQSSVDETTNKEDQAKEEYAYENDLLLDDEEDPLNAQVDSSASAASIPRSDYLFSRTEDHVASVLQNLYFKQNDALYEQIFSQKVPFPYSRRLIDLLYLASIKQSNTILNQLIISYNCWDGHTKANMIEEYGMLCLSQYSFEKALDW